MIHVRYHLEPPLRGSGIYWQEFKSIGWLCPVCAKLERAYRKMMEMRRYRVKLKGDKARRRVRKEFKRIFKWRFPIELRKATRERAKP